MSELIVIGYDDQATATQAYNQVLALNKDFVVKLTGLAIVTVDAEGKSHVDTPQKIVGVSAASGVLWGMLIGLLFFVPGVGLLLGGAMGELFGKLGQTGINDQFRSQVQDMLKPGNSAVVIMADKITEDKFADAMKPYGGQVLRTSLDEGSDEESQDLTTLTRGIATDLRPDLSDSEIDEAAGNIVQRVLSQATVN